MRINNEKSQNKTLFLDMAYLIFFYLHFYYKLMLKIRFIGNLPCLLQKTTFCFVDCKRIISKADDI